MTELASWRKQLDVLDLELLEVLAKRFAINREVRRYKAANELPMLDASREKSMLEERVRYAQERGIDAKFAEELYLHILEYVKSDRF